MPIKAEDCLGIAPTDLNDIRLVFDKKTIPHNQISWYYNDDADRWEVYDRGVGIDKTDTLIAHYEVGGPGWVEV